MYNVTFISQAAKTIKAKFYYIHEAWNFVQTMTEEHELKSVLIEWKE